MLRKAKDVIFHRMSWLYLLLCFPIIDHTLRNIIPIPVVSSLWDEGLLILLLIIALIRIGVDERRLPSMRTPLAAFVVLGIAMLVFDMSNFSVNIEGFRAVYQYILAFIIGFYMLNTERESLNVFRIFVVVAGLIGLHGVYQYIIGVEVPAGWIDSSESVRTRAFSIVQSPNVLGSFMAFGAPIALGLALTDRGRRRWLWAILAIVMLAALVFTGSRGAWLAFGGAIGLALLLLNRKLFIGFLIATVLVAAFVPQVSSRFEALFDAEYLEKSSENGRIQRWIGAYDQMRNNPVYGLGLGHYGGAVADRHFGTIYVDSYYFKTVAETGLLGLGIYLWLMVMLLRNSFTIWKASAKKRQFFLYGGIFAGMLAVILHNGVENIFEVPFMNTFFWLIAGVLLSLPYLKPADPEAGDTHTVDPDGDGSASVVGAAVGATVGQASVDTKAKTKDSSDQESVTESQTDVEARTEPETKTGAQIEVESVAEADGTPDANNKTANGDSAGKSNRPADASSSDPANGQGGASDA